MFLCENSGELPGPWCCFRVQSTRTHCDWCVNFVVVSSGDAEISTPGRVSGGPICDERNKIESYEIVWKKNNILPCRKSYGSRGSICRGIGKSSCNLLFKIFFLTSSFGSDSSWYFQTRLFCTLPCSNCTNKHMKTIRNKYDYSGPFSAFGTFKRYISQLYSARNEVSLPFQDILVPQNIVVVNV